MIRELHPPKPVTHLVESSSGIIQSPIFNPLPLKNMASNWMPFNSKPYSEQWTGKFDEDNCITQSAINMIENILNYCIKNPEVWGTGHDTIVNGLKELKFINDQGFVQLSIRFSSVMNGTTQLGNTIENVWSSFSKDGFLPLSLYPDPLSGFSRETYYTKPSQDLIDYAKKINTLINIQWKIVWDYVKNGSFFPPSNDIKQWLQDSPLQMVGPSCPRDATGVQISCGSVVCQHGRMINAYDSYYEMLDSYPPYLTKTALNYPIPYLVSCGLNIV